MIWGPANVRDLFGSCVAGPQRVQKLKRVKHRITQACVHLHIDLLWYSQGPESHEEGGWYRKQGQMQ